MEELKLGQIVKLDCEVVSITHSKGKVRYGVRLSDGTLIQATQDEARNENGIKFKR